MDSASNNQTKMEGLEHLMAAYNPAIEFDPIGNRARYESTACYFYIVRHANVFYRCFPHAINRSVKAIFESLKKNPALPAELLTNSARQAYSDALISEPVKRVRELVAACRKSGTRRTDLMNTIKRGNEHKLWEDGQQIPERQLLRDCDTRWSSTFQMIARALSLYPVRLNSYKDDTSLLPTVTGHSNVHS